MNRSKAQPTCHSCAPIGVLFHTSSNTRSSHSKKNRQQSTNSILPEFLLSENSHIVEQPSSRRCCGKPLTLYPSSRGSQHSHSSSVGAHLQVVPNDLNHCRAVRGHRNRRERGFDPRTSGLWAQHASTAPLCSLISGKNCVLAMTKRQECRTK
ncbi:hypothetical protein MAR_023099 [Mya arenaria]|uniref:Uncharacterized protein n=1 Tax=Mya arenaria TaxID=6604 RepID=A0ABY7DP79_MYAAR|nr:hypothetical protein MAR_023099 [Mya arenaria]